MLTTAAVFTDHMVLQCEKPIPLWGHAEPGKKVTAVLGDESVTTVTASDGTYTILFGPKKAGTGYLLRISSGDESLEYADVAMGEVWLAGGQSNMELMLAESMDGKKAVSESGNDNIRFYMVPKCAVTGPELEAAEAGNVWQVCGPETSAVMSAVAYYFARHLQTVREVPVGIICCAWGGTSISCWMSKSQLMKTAAGLRYIEDYDRLVGDKTDEQYEAEMDIYRQEWEAWNARVAERRQADPDVTWEILNEECGLCPWPQPAGRRSPFRPAGLYSSMTERVCPYGIRGFLYYQGEEDESRYADYDWMMISLIMEWREVWGDMSLPFLFVQLPMYISKADWNQGIDNRHWAMMRDQQMKASLMIANTGLAVLSDCGEFDNIHPLDKETVGTRLALLARKKVYGEVLCAEAPSYDKVVFREGKAVVHFCHTGGRLWDGAEALSGFELAGKDGIFRPAVGCIETDTVILVSEQVPEPAYVRYAWHNYCHANLYGASGLPAAPFRTDHFFIEKRRDE